MPRGGCREPSRAAALRSCAGCSRCWPGGGAADPLGAGPGRGVRPRGRCGRAEVAQPEAPSTCAQRGTQRRTQGAVRPQVSGPGRAASNPGFVGSRGTRGGSAARVGSEGAVPHSSPRWVTRPGRARDPRARREAERGVRAGALSAGESPRCPRSVSNSGCFGNFPGAPPVECTEMRHAVKTHSRGFVCFQFVRWEKDEG